MNTFHRLSKLLPTNERMNLLLDTHVFLWLASGIKELPVTLEHALAVKELPNVHADPFDRLLIAQAQVEGLSLVTSDRNILKYDVRTLPA